MKLLKSKFEINGSSCEEKWNAKLWGRLGKFETRISKLKTSFKQTWTLQDVSRRVPTRSNQKDSVCCVYRSVDRYWSLLLLMKMFMNYDRLIPEEVNVWSSLVLWYIFPIMIEVQGLPQYLDTPSCHPTFHRVGLKYFFFVKLKVFLVSLLTASRLTYV